MPPPATNAAIEVRALTKRYGDQQALAGLIECARGAGILAVDLRRPSLEHVFLHHTGHAFEEAP
jgi:hypothetical protein